MVLLEIISVNAFFGAILVQSEDVFLVLSLSLCWEDTVALRNGDAAYSFVYDEWF